MDSRHVFGISLTLVLLSSFFFASSAASDYLPVVCMHGIFSSMKVWTNFEGYIQQEHPGTQVYALDIYDHLSSITSSLWLQVAAVRTAIEALNLSTPYHYLCHSQGCIIGKALIETWPNHNIVNFIAVSGPLSGQYGDTSYLSWFFPTIGASEVWHLAYTSLGQNDLSLSDFWKDPNHMDLYFEKSIFLPIIDNNSPAPFNSSLRDNFLQLNEVVLIGGAQDGVISPWQSAHCRFFAPGSTTQVLELEDMPDYIEDSIGLRTMNEAGRVHFFEFDGIIHVDLPRNSTVFYKAVLPYLK